ncbi:MAG: hypothetical protein BWX85_00577 [Chloroflexi bacterium ADurb.Bin120]|jgi:hypothetical protein|nr:MAG: hypothetical protein BWX85_00577 [Chloroflexi bacterium ADurb.Bin120]
MTSILISDYRIIPRSGHAYGLTCGDVTGTIIDGDLRNRQTAFHTDRVLYQSSVVMEDLPDNHIHLMVTSLSCNTQKEGAYWARFTLRQLLLTDA